MVVQAESCEALIAPSVESGFKKDQFVRIHGLKSVSLHFLNGSIGRIDEIPVRDGDTRYMIVCAVSHHEPVQRKLFRKSIKAGNLLPLTNEEFDADRLQPFKEGDFVEIYGLANAKELNHKFAQVVGIDSRISVAVPCVGTMTSSSTAGLNATTSVMKKIKPENLRRYPAIAVPKIDIKLLAAEITAEVLYVWNQKTCTRYANELTTKHKCLFRILAVKGVSHTERNAVHVRLQSLFEGNPEWDAHICGNKVVRVCASDIQGSNEEEQLLWSKQADEENLLDDDDWTSKYGLSKDSVFESIIVNDEPLKIPVAEVNRMPARGWMKNLENFLMKAKEDAKKDEPFEGLMVTFKNDIPLDYESNQSPFLPTYASGIDVRLIKKVVRKKVRASGKNKSSTAASSEAASSTGKETEKDVTDLAIITNEGTDNKETSADGTSPDSTIVKKKVHKVAEVSASEQLNVVKLSNGKFQFTKTQNLEDKLGGYDHAHAMHSSVLTLQKSGEIIYILCSILMQLEPQILLVYEGNVIYDLRIADGVIVKPKRERIDRLTDFSSDVKENGQRCVDFSISFSEAFHTWITFKRVDITTTTSSDVDGTEGPTEVVTEDLILDPTGAQFEIYGDKISIHPDVPDVFINVASQADETFKYYHQPAPAIPLYVQSIPFLIWVRSRFDVTSPWPRKMGDICSNFLEKRYPESVRTLPRPYNFPEFPEVLTPEEAQAANISTAYKFFGMSVLNDAAEDVADMKNINVVDLLLQLQSAVPKFSRQIAKKKGIEVEANKTAVYVVKQEDFHPWFDKLPLVKQLTQKMGIRSFADFKTGSINEEYAKKEIGSEEWDQEKVTETLE